MRGTWGKRGFVATIAAVCCASGVALNASPAVAASKLVAAGTVHCTATGSINVGPQLSATPNPKTKLIVKAKFACTQGETGNSAVTVVSGSMTAKFGLLTADCTTTNFGGGSAIVQWKTNGGSLAKSMFTWASATLTDGSSVTLDLAGPGGAETGSYQGSSHTMHIVGDATTGGICGPVAKGKVVKFTGANGASTLDITPPNPNNLPVNHVVVLMQENRSADTYFGPLSTQGQAGYEPEPTTGNPDPTNPGGPAIVPFHKTTYCEVADLDHSWTGTHNEYDGGAMDGFTAQNAIAQDPTGSRAMGYYDQTPSTPRCTTPSRPATVTSRPC